MSERERDENLGAIIRMMFMETGMNPCFLFDVKVCDELVRSEVWVSLHEADMNVGNAVNYVREKLLQARIGAAAHMERSIKE